MSFEEQNKALVQRFYEEIDKGNVDAPHFLGVSEPGDPPDRLEPYSLQLRGRRRALTARPPQ